MVVSKARANKSITEQPRKRHIIILPSKLAVSLNRAMLLESSLTKRLVSANQKQKTNIPKPILQLQQLIHPFFSIFLK